MTAVGFWPLVDAFLPELGSAEEERRGRMVIVAALMASLCFGGSAFVFWRIEGMAAEVVAGLVGAPLFLGVLWLFRRTRSVAVGAHALASIAFALFIVTALQNGGIGEPATFTASLVPFAVALIAGWRTASPWALATLLQLLGVHWLHLAGYRFPNPSPPETLYERQVAGTLIMIVFLGVAAAAYESSRTAALRILEKKNRALETAHREIFVLARLLGVALEDRPLEDLLTRFLENLLTIPWLRVRSEAAFFLVDEDSSLRLVAERNLAKPLLEVCARVPFGTCLCGRAAATAETQYASGVDERHEHGFPGMKPHGHYNVPVRMADELLGVMVLYLEEGRARDERDVFFLESAARIAAGMISRVRQVREREQMHIQLAQAQKLESIGQLAAGIAHEINTPAQYVGDNLEFLEQSFGELGELLKRYQALLAAAGEGEVPAELVAEVREAAEAADVEFLEEEIPRALAQSREGIGRVSKIVRAMKDFSHPGSEQKEPIDLNHAIESTVTVARNEWKYVAELEMELDEGLPPVPCLAAEMNQVVLNIVVNAAHALGDQREAREGEGKGRIFVRTRSEGDVWAVVEIEDTGPGIPEEIRDRIFDPFFTTKEVGKGTGQGLAIARSIVVDKHGGTLDVASEPGQGTTFTIRLPLGMEE